MGYTFLDFAKEVLLSAQNPLSYKEIWARCVNLGLHSRLDSAGKTPEQTLAAQLYTNCKKPHSPFVIASKKPTLFWLKDQTMPLESGFDTIPSDAQSPMPKFCERDLHPLLVKFLFENERFDLYCKTIYHEKSLKSSSGRDKWNYPDIVGIHFPFGEYEESTIELLANFNKPNYKLYSFELKIALEWGNVKESYFQAVSNSSWANEGYLVVFEHIDDEILSELVRLNASFGIGVIELECESAQSKVVLPARTREIDIETLDMLTDKNVNFREFVANINKDIRAKDIDRIAKNQYDTIKSDEQMQGYLKEKGIFKKD